MRKAGTAREYLAHDSQLPEMGSNGMSAKPKPAGWLPDMDGPAAESIAAGWKARLLMNDKGAPKALLANAITALRMAPEWAGVLGFNEFSLGTVALKPAPWQTATSGEEWTDHEDRLTADWLQHHGILVGVEVAGQAAQTVARDRALSSGSGISRRAQVGRYEAHRHVAQPVPGR